MKPATLLRIGLVWLVLVAPGSMGMASGMRAYDIVRHALQEKGIRVGYDSDHDIIVNCGVAHTEVPSISGDFENQRAQSFFLAEAEARTSIMRSINWGLLDGGGSIERVSTPSGTKSIEHIAFVPYGYQVLEVAETLENGILSTAVAVLWSSKLEKDERFARFSPPEAFPAVPDSRQPSPEWSSWFQRQDAGHAQGFRSFRDSEGIRRFAGIGTADIEGKTGGELAAAMAEARKMASANLAYALFGSVEFPRDSFKADYPSPYTISSLRTLLRERMDQSRRIALNDAEVFSTTVVHPLTGRQLYVSVAGIEPTNLAAMRMAEVLGGEITREMLLPPDPTLSSDEDEPPPASLPSPPQVEHKKGRWWRSLFRSKEDGRK